MAVISKFFSNHMNSGYIDRVISDAANDISSNTLPLEIIERDDYYQIIRTPKHNNLIAIYEGDAASKNIPKNSIHVYFNSTRTTVVIDETGINVKTEDNINMTVTQNVKITVNGAADEKGDGQRDGPHHRRRPAGKRAPRAARQRGWPCWKRPPGPSPAV